MKTKLTTLEKRALAFCNEIRSSGGPYPINVEWKKSPTWGLCPSIRSGGEKIAHASGCGYCKLSTVLAAALCFITGDPENPARLSGGAGVPVVTQRLKELGWDLRCVASSGTFDGFTITKIPA
jgi:hypothetical protein